MSDKFTNNVRARLYKQGYQGFTKDDYTTAALAVECDDLDNPTKEQLSQAVDYLKVKSTSQLSFVDEPVEETFLVGSEDAQPDPELDNSQLTIAAPEINSITVTSDDKRQIVTAQSSALGFELTEQETLSIAENVDDTFTDYSQFISTVTAAIKNYVDQKFDVIEQS
ncbi:MAG: hypothetical protein ACYTX0_37500, partial [Nostoc sp.]